MSILFLIALLVLAAVGIALRIMSRFRLMEAAASTAPGAVVPGRYRPMLRLLDDRDVQFASVNPKLARTLKAERRKLFRTYLACLTRDYGRLLAGIRVAMVQSGIDRPDLARALAKNRTLFALAVCKIEFRLAMHAAGIGRVDVSGLVEAFETLRTQVGIFAQTAVASTLAG